MPGSQKYSAMANALANEKPMSPVGIGTERGR
jgi:hypothetical protein